VVESHMNHVLKALQRFDVSLGRHGEEERKWIDRLLSVLERTAAGLAKGGE